jgi:Ca2+-binding RTX toxin-like protein
MSQKKIRRLFFVTLGVAIILGIVSGFAANVAVPVTRLTNQARAVTANTLKPASCSAITLTTVVVCTGGNCDGSNANELLLGTANAERIRGRGGTDCILGGGGNDQLVGNGSSDVCIGGSGTDTFTTCETQIQ